MLQGPAYNPQVEAISPILPSESLRDESPLKSTKEELLAQIARVDREIAKTESQIAKLKKKKIELEQAATQPQKDSEENSNASDSSALRSLPQCIYTENRKKAVEAHNILNKLGPKVDLPLYNQPSDTGLYHENKLRYISFKAKLIEYFKTRLKEKDKRESYLTTTYAKLSTQWAKKLEKMEHNAKRRNKEAKNREVFEKIFPELRKQREDKERFSRVGSRIKSDADLEEIMDGLHEQELEDKKMRSYAVIPPILLDERARKRRFNNRNGLIEDPMQEYKDKQLLNLWTESEKELFKEKYLQHPKNFGIIKSYLERKSVADCVQYYYMSKKTQNYRQLLRKNRARTRSTRNQQQNTANNNSQSVLSVVKNEPSGVSTRQQKEQKNDQQSNSNSTSNNSVHSNMIQQSTEGNSNADAANDNSNFTGATESSMSMELGLNSVPQQSSLQSDYSGQPKKTRTKQDAKEEMDTSDEDNLELNGDKGGPHNCVVCKTNLESYVQSRPLVPSQAVQYGLNEETGERVCHTCRCKAERLRYKPGQCPIPTCPSRKARVKRLRPFPSRWGELNDEIREAIRAKYQIPANATKCCTACFNRISRRLNPNTSLYTPDDPGSDTSRWTDDEISLIKKALVEFGTDWRKLSERITTKSELQCRNFYFNFRKKYGLDTLVQEFKKSKGGDGGPSNLTDESDTAADADDEGEWVTERQKKSGSTTSSCDDTEMTDRPRGPTQPPVPEPQSRQSHLEKKDDYDSSATVSAEEGGLAESEKPHSIEDTKTLPNHPDAPLQLTMRPNSSSLIQTTPNQQQSSSHVQSHHPGQTQQHHHPNSQLVSGVVVTAHVPHAPPVSRYTSQVSQHRASPHGPHHAALYSWSSHQRHHHQPLLSHPGSAQQQSQQSGVVHPHGGHHPVRQSSPENNEPNEPMTLGDLMIKTIERQLGGTPISKNSQQPQNQNASPGPSLSPTPTITSILKTQDRSHLPPPGQHLMISTSQNHPISSPQQQPQGPPMSVSSSHFPPLPQHPMYYGAGNKGDIRNVSTTHHIVTRDHPLIQVQQQSQQQHHHHHAPQQQSRDECETLDLSIKKPRSHSPSPQRSMNSGPPPAHQPLDFTSRPDDGYSKYQHINIARPPQQLAPLPPKPSKVLPPPPLLTKPNLSPIKDGSITHGTPLHHPQVRFPDSNSSSFSHAHNRQSNIRSYSQPMSTKYEGLLRPMAKEGSITQGTPLDKGRGKEAPMSISYNINDRGEYLKRVSPAAPYYGSPSPYPYGQRPPSAGQQQPQPRSSSPGAPPSAYALDQHNNSRQTIINDFYTSQQMQQPPPHPPPSPQSAVHQQQVQSRGDIKRNLIPSSVGGGPGGPVYVIPSRHEVYRPSTTPPTHQSQQQQLPQRQGVIHRTNQHRPVVKVEQNPGQRYAAGDAFTALADVAAAQPSLPVPKEELRSRSSLPLPRVDMQVPEGLGKSMAEMERNRISSSQSHQLPPQMYRPPPGQSNQPPPESLSRTPKSEVGNRYNRDTQDATLTAGSLIDAIITHQINQPSPHDSAPQGRTGDRYFASFQRPVQVPVNAYPTGSSVVHDDIKQEDSRPIDYKNPQGGTWGDHIDLIISKDYASGKGAGQGGGAQQQPQSHQQQPPPSSVERLPVSLSQHQSSVLQQTKREEDTPSYINWKLRRALQQDKEREFQQVHQSHPDERHIIRLVASSEAQQLQHSRPASVPTSSKELNYPPVSTTEEGCDIPTSMKSEVMKLSGMPGVGGAGATMGPGDLFPRRTGSREGISALDYVKNRIIESMRTEDEKSDDSPSGLEPNSSASMSSAKGSSSSGYSAGGHKSSNSAVSPSGHPTEPKDLIRHDSSSRSDRDSDHRQSSNTSHGPDGDRS